MKKLFTIALFFFCKIVVGQKFGLGPDAQFSQFFANPLYHNPAFTGEAGATRLMATFRSQWAGLGDGGYKSYIAGIDGYASRGLGLGFLAFRDEQFKNFSTTSLSGLASYNIVINDNNVVVFGLQGSWVFNQINDLSNLKFVDRFSTTSNSVVINPSIDPLANKGGLSWNYLNFSGGFLWKNSPYMDNDRLVWAGGTWHNIKFSEKDFQPKGRVGLQAGFKIPHHLDFIGHGRVKDMERERNIAFTTHFRKQGRFSQLDMGVNFQYSPINLGVWYRNMPFKRADFPGQDAITFITGVKFGKFMFEYSYDLTVSSLNRTTAGANEITLWYGLDFDLDLSLNGLDRRRKLKCTNF